MIDQARRKGIEIDRAKMEKHLGCAVVLTSARHREGIDDLVKAVGVATAPTSKNSSIEEVLAACIVHPTGPARDRVAERLDGVLTHPVLGVVVFAAIMIGLFWTIFEFASIPMDLIDLIFGYVGQGLTALLPAGALRDLIVDGVVGGLAGTVVFLPQIVLLFFLIALLEDTGYLARAAFVMDRLLRRFGLPGQAFVPMLSAHACAIPAIMAARLVPDRRDRLATILVAPFLSCSARLPVYVLLIGVLFADAPLLAGVVFAACYALGILAALLSSLLVRSTILKGPHRLFVIELPPYQWPSLRGALLTCWDRGLLFIRNAGTVILAMVIVLWWLSSYPKPPEETTQTSALEYSFAGRIGQAVQPVFEPMDWDWQLTVGVMSSFAAREVFVSTMAVLVAGTDDTEDASVLTSIAEAKRDDGRAMLTPTRRRKFARVLRARDAVPSHARGDGTRSGRLEMGDAPICVDVWRCVLRSVGDVCGSCRELASVDAVERLAILGRHSGRHRRALVASPTIPFVSTAWQSFPGVIDRRWEATRTAQETCASSYDFELAVKQA